MENKEKGCEIKSILSVNELITISKQRFSGGYFFRGESHNSYELVCVLSGTVGITAGKNVFALSAGQITVHPPTEFHAIWEHGNSRPECIIASFTASAFPKITSRIHTVSSTGLQSIESIYQSSKEIFDIAPSNSIAYGEGDERTDFDFGLRVLDIKQGKSYAACIFAKELELFLLSVLSSPSDIEIQTSDTSSENYSKILKIMETHIDDKLNMTELSRLCGMSAPLIEKTVYKYLRCGAMAYYNNIRMNKAHRLLSHGESVKNVASILHFATQNYFSLSFKKHFGYPPSKIKA